MVLKNAFEELATEAKQDDIIAAIGAAQTALENIDVTIDTPTDFPDTATLAKVEAVRALLAGTLTVSDGTTHTGLAAIISALGALAVSVSNFPADYPSTAVLAKVEAVRVLLAGTLTVTGPLTDAQLRATAVPVSGPLTDTELRATPPHVVDMAKLVPDIYDALVLGYTGDQVTTVTYKTGGVGGTTVATLTLIYSGAQLVSVART